MHRGSNEAQGDFSWNFSRLRGLLTESHWHFAKLQYYYINSLGGTIRISTTRGYPQEEDLSLLLWCLVAERLLEELNDSRVMLMTLLS
jgi:hypothetical protein